jgi:hypothetical protein
MFVVDPDIARETLGQLLPSRSSARTPQVTDLEATKLGHAARQWLLRAELDRNMRQTPFPFKRDGEREREEKERTEKLASEAKKGRHNPKKDRNWLQTNLYARERERERDWER